MQYLDGPLEQNPAETRRVYHGPALRTLRRLCGNRDGAAVSQQVREAWGELIAPPLSDLRPARSAAGWRLPAALLDGCLVACGALARRQLGLLSLPGGFRRLVVQKLPAPDMVCRVALRLTSREERFLSFDFVLSDETDQPLLFAEGYRAIVLTASGEQAPQ
jgi:hypothetical protein